MGITRAVVPNQFSQTGTNDARPLSFSLTSGQKKAIFAATLGTVVEWTDWLIYATFSSVLAGQFFPANEATANLLSILAIFAVGFAIRPIGGAVLGAFGDRYGRKRGLTLSISLMACASFVIGICPTYGSIGALAPVILVIARLVQGFSAGGEFGSASTFLIESAPIIDGPSPDPGSTSLLTPACLSPLRSGSFSHFSRTMKE
jgi:MFS transporter, MHS family, alpha-ketoglutarate permease